MLHPVRVVALTAALFGAVLVPDRAEARNDVVQIGVSHVREGADQTRVLSDVSWHMNGEKHRGVAKSFNLAATRKSTNKTFKSDENACSRAFLSAIIQLQTAARNLGADGVVDIKSNAEGQSSDGADTFLCTAGTFVAHVSLTGVPVKFK